MTGHIIQLHGDQHLEARSLLPWYVTGRLDATERAQVEAHLNGCPECQMELKIERGLQARIAGLPMDVEQGWAKLRDRLERDPPRRPRFVDWRRRLRVAWSSWPPWALVAQAALMLVVSAALLTLAQGNQSAAARYHVLGAAPAAAAGNVVVIFAPQTSEGDLRRILQADHARAVDGPTSTGAWLVHVPAARRAAALARLRGLSEVRLAEPVDADEPR
jgi:anti-sigma factor RsiW